MTEASASVSVPPFSTPQPPRYRPGPPESVPIWCIVVTTGVRRSWPSHACTARPTPKTGAVALEPSLLTRPPQPPAIQSYHMKYGLDSLRPSRPPTSRYSRLKAQAMARSGMIPDHSSKIPFMIFS